jgi:5-bromo-4-chloroindolyl phosphate hydrolysis protein
MREMLYKMIFQSFNEYKLLGRMFSLKAYFYDESEQVQDLTDYYLELKKKPKLKKKEVQLFNDLNLLMNNINEVEIRRKANMSEPNVLKSEMRNDHKW